MRSSFIKKIAFILTINLIISPAFFFHSKIVLAKEDSLDPKQNPNTLFGKTKQQFNNVITSTSQSASVFSGLLSRLSNQAYCALSGLFSNTCDIQGTTSVVLQSVKKQTPVATRTTYNLDTPVDKPKAVDVPPAPKSFLSNSIQTIQSTISLAFLNQRLAELKAEILAEVPTTQNTQGVPVRRFSKQTDYSTKHAAENISDAISGGETSFNGTSLTVTGAVTATSFVGDGSQLTGISSLSASDLNALTTIEVGDGNTASGSYSSAVGYANTASALNSSVFGRSNFTGTGLASVALGILNNQTGGTLNTTTGVITGTPVEVNAGRLSTAVGVRNTASGNLSSAIGYVNTASGISSSASGNYNTASGYRSSAFGRSNTASGSYSLTIGYINAASGQSSSAFGRSNTASATSSSAFGRSNTASGNYSSASGYGNTASALNSSVFGRSNFTGTGLASVVLGIFNNQTGGTLNTTTGVITGTPVAVNAGRLSTAVGVRNTASGNLSSSVGFLNTASGYISSAVGYFNTASGAQSTAIGYSNTASNTNSLSVGRSNTVSGSNSSAFGISNTASATYSSAFGSFVNNSVASSVQIGASNTEKLQISSSGIDFITAGAGTFTVNGSPIGGFNANTLSPIEVGDGNDASGTDASAVGYINIASGISSSAFGRSNTASGDFSLSLGGYNHASAAYSSASGYSNTASEFSSSAFGYDNTASATSSSAVGYINNASGYFSSAFGHSNTASGQSSSAFGSSNFANAILSSVAGAFNNRSGVNIDNSGSVYAAGLESSAGIASSAFGIANQATGIKSSAVGYQNTASGSYSNTFGYANTASTASSTAVGIGLTNSTADSTMIGVGTGFINVLSDGSITSSTGASLTSGGTWTNASSIALKENFTDLDKEALLEKIGQLELQSWNYKSEDASIKHIGPLAEQFYELFGLGGSTNSISTIDPAGLALVGIQALTSKFDWIGEYITRGVDGITGIFTRVQTKELCLDDVCINKDQLQQLLDSQNIDANPVTPPNTTGTTGTSTPPSDPDPTDNGTSTPPVDTTPVDTEPTPDTTPGPDTEPVIEATTDPVVEPTPAPEPTPEPEPDSSPVSQESSSDSESSSQDSSSESSSTPSI